MADEEVVEETAPAEAPAEDGGQAADDAAPADGVQAAEGETAAAGEQEQPATTEGETAKAEEESAAQELSPEDPQAGQDSETVAAQAATASAATASATSGKNQSSTESDVAATLLVSSELPIEVKKPALQEGSKAKSLGTIYREESYRQYEVANKYTFAEFELSDMADAFKVFCFELVVFNLHRVILFLLSTITIAALSSAIIIYKHYVNSNDVDHCYPMGLRQEP